MTDGPVRLGAVNIPEVYLDREATIDRDCRYIQQAGEEDVDVLVFPEFHVPANPRWFQYDDDHTFESYYEELYREAVEIGGPGVSRLQEAAAEAGCVVVMGANLRQEEDTSLYNAQLFIDSDGSLLGARRKLAPTTFEKLMHTGGSGQDVQVFGSAVGPVSGMMCGEHLNQLLAFSLMAEGQQLHAAAWPLYPGGTQEVIQQKIGVRTRYHAEAAKVPTALAMGAVDDQLASAIGEPSLADAASMAAIISPTGEYLAGPSWDDTGLVHAEVDPGDRMWEKSHHDLLGHYNRFDIFDLEVDRSPQRPDI